MCIEKEGEEKSNQPKGCLVERQRTCNENIVPHRRGIRRRERGRELRDERGGRKVGCEDERGGKEVGGVRKRENYCSTYDKGKNKQGPLQNKWKWSKDRGGSLRGR